MPCQHSPALCQLVPAEGLACSLITTCAELQPQVAGWSPVVTLETPEQLAPLVQITKSEGFKK